MTELCPNRPCDTGLQASEFDGGTGSCRRISQTATSVKTVTSMKVDLNQLSSRTSVDAGAC